MIEVRIKDDTLRCAADKGMDAFVCSFVSAVKDAIGGELTAETMSQLNADQITVTVQTTSSWRCLNSILSLTIWMTCLLNRKRHGLNR